MKKLIIICAALLLTSPAFAVFNTTNSDYTNPYTTDAYTRGLWHFDQEYGDTIFDDASANGNWGTLVTGYGHERSETETWITSKAGFDTNTMSWSENNRGPMEVPQGYGDGTDTNNSLDIGSGTDLTVEFWMKPTWADNNYVRILQKYTGGSYTVEWKANTIRFVHSYSGWKTIASADTVALDVWTHVAVCVDRTTSDTDRIGFFYNGVIGSEGWIDAWWSGHSGSTSPGESLYIGGRYDGNPTSTFYGELDELRISDVIRYIPEPTTITLLAMAALAFLRRKK